MTTNMHFFFISRSFPLRMRNVSDSKLKTHILHVTFRGPCIVIDSYNKNNEMN